eukprot:NODE_9703_length_570_cov_67.800895_g9066_i0.p1 GENE.NODE_9703_length_570_cov_67.800895_g9066_i0~~NODE_9703_length_570_cov_67.800895_g9066_i0.p1  ORF type:complete len:170 (+),score=28.01 NODE_9703_length_570_cov_67.800895_g9066_i0:78-512(+)
MTFTYLICRPIAGVYSDRIPKWTIEFGGILSLGFGLCILGSSYSLILVVLGICLVGAGVAFITTPAFPLLADIVEMQGSEGYGLVYAMADISTSAGMIAGPMSGSLLNSFVSFNTSCQVVGMLCLSCVFCCLHLRHLDKVGRAE